MARPVAVILAAGQVHRQQVLQFFDVLRHICRPEREMHSPRLESERDVLQAVFLPLGFQLLQQIGFPSAERFFGPGRKGDDKRTRRAFGAHSRCGGGFDNQVRVGPADAEAADGGPARRLPLKEGRIHIKRACGEIEMRVGRPEANRRGDFAVADGQDRLYQADDARRERRVAYGALHRSDGAKARLVREPPKGVRERFQFDGVSQPGPRPVRLHIGDGCRVDAAAAIDGNLQVCLRVSVGGRDAVAAPVMVHAGASDDGVNVVAVPQGGFEGLEDHGGRGFPRNEPVGAVVEGAALPLFRQNARIGRVDEKLGRGAKKYAARDHHLRLFVLDGPACQMDRREGGGAGRVDGHRGAGEIQEIGDPRRQERPVVRP